MKSAQKITNLVNDGYCRSLKVPETKNKFVKESRIENEQTYLKMKLFVAKYTRKAKFHADLFSRQQLPSKVGPQPPTGARCAATPIFGPIMAQLCKITKTYTTAIFSMLYL